MATTRKTYTAEFKLQAVRMATDRRLAVAEVARRLGVSESRRHDWLKAFRTQGSDAFPGHGRLSPSDEELHRLRGEVQRLKAERLLRLARTTRRPDPTTTTATGSRHDQHPRRSSPLLRQPTQGG